MVTSLLTLLIWLDLLCLLHYLSLAAGLNGLAGPLHGRANQEVLEWLFKLREEVNGDYSKETIEKYLWDTLELR